MLCVSSAGEDSRQESGEMVDRAGSEDIRAVVFDFDGTLAVQTLDFGLMRERAAEALSRYAPVAAVPTEPVMEELERACAGLSADIAVKARQATLAAIEKVELEAARHSCLFPCVRPMLAALRGRNIASAVITRNILPAIRMVFPDVMQYCVCVLTRDDVVNVKPHPDHLRKALELIACKPCNALMVGDHPMDIQVGKSVGALTAGVASGHVSLERLAMENPTWLADDVGQLMQRIGLTD